MSEQTAEAVRRAYKAFNRGDLEGMFADAAPEFEYLPTGAIPGAGDVYRGHEEFRQFLNRWWGEFDEPHVEVHELIEASDQVLASVTFRGYGSRAAWRPTGASEGMTSERTPTPHSVFGALRERLFERAICAGRP
jgi:ketosteroid isomerase-like protein